MQALSARLERLIRPRWGFMLTGLPRALVGLALMLAGLLLGLPLPIPGSTVSGAFLGLLVALGLPAEDGLSTSFGTNLTIGACVALGVLLGLGVVQVG
jgi:hypothetical protein